MKVEDLYEINDELTAMADRFGAKLTDETLDDLTHHVATVIESGRAS